MLCRRAARTPLPHRLLYVALLLAAAVSLPSSAGANPRSDPHTRAEARPAPATVPSAETPAPPTPAPLQAALDKLIADTDRWAYTQEIQEFDRSGRPEEGLTRERYDPSQPEGSQWSLLLYRGRVPTSEERSSWERRKRREERRRDRPLGEILDFPRATLREESAEAWSYLVPIKPRASRRLPAEKFTVQIDVSRARTEIARVRVWTNESFRLTGLTGLVAKVDDVQIDARFAVVDAAFPAQPATVQAAGSGRIAWLFPVGGKAEITWGAFARVKPYRDRFNVEIGEVKALDF
jgi:hypothetical protein